MINFDPVMSLLTILGVMAHCVKKMAKDKISFRDYWFTNSGDSISSLIGSAIGYIMLTYYGVTDPIYYISLGFIGDSILNKIESTNIAQIGNNPNA